MYLNRSCSNQTPTNSSPVARCCIVGIPSANLTSIIDIKWDGSSSVSLVRNLSRPNSHSFILGTDTLPIGYSFTGGILYFPPNESVSADQFAVWTAPTGPDACNSYVWVSTKICVSVNCLDCRELI
jgi:hypothetical protein